MAKLSDLKGLLGAAATDQRIRASGTTKKAEARAATKAAARGIAAEIDLAHVFADVAPLAAANRARVTKERAAPTPARRLADEAAALAESRRGLGADASGWDVGAESEAEQTFRREGLGPDIVGKLRRAHWVVQADLDLHGHTSDEAHDAMVLFFAEARRRGWRCVRVIHGKGLSSPNREPVLKGKVRRWLTRRDEVLAYCEAPRTGGGSGAVLVLLKSPSA